MNRKDTLAAREEMWLLAARDAALQGNEGPFARWITEHRGRMRGTLNRIATRRGQPYLLDDAGFVEDVLNTCGHDAWRAIIGFRWFCPLCSREDKRHGQVRCRSFERCADLLWHLYAAHESRDAQIPGIGRRVWYLIGSRMQSALRQRARFVARHKLGIEDDQGSLGYLESADPRQFRVIASIEARIDRERKLESLSPKNAAKVAWLYAGLPPEDVKGVLSQDSRRAAR